MAGRSAALGAAMMLAAVCAPILALGFPQIPKKISTVRNESTVQVTFECRMNNEWQKVIVDAQKDVNITGDRVRIATDRQDKATVTIEFPIEGGKKYIVFWNDPPGMWDFKDAF